MTQNLIASARTKELFNSYPIEIKPVILGLCKIDKVRAIIIKIQNMSHQFKGISIDFLKMKGNTSILFPYKISINPSLSGDYDEIASYIISGLCQMELQKAFKILRKDLKQRMQSNRTVSIDKYVKKAEKIHFKALKKRAEILNKLSENGQINPGVSGQYIASNFNEFYLLQQCCGHTTDIVRNYTKLCSEGSYHPYQGTWVQRVLHDEVPYLRSYFLCRVKMQIEDQKDEAIEEMSQLKKTIQNLQNRALSFRMVTHFQNLGKQFQV